MKYTHFLAPRLAPGRNRAVLFIVQGVSYLLLSRGQFRWTVNLAVSGTLIVIGILFLLHRFSVHQECMN